MHARYRKLLGRGKCQQHVVTAVGREFLSFIWAIGVTVERQQQKASSSTRRNGITEGESKKKAGTMVAEEHTERRTLERPIYWGRPAAEPALLVRGSSRRITIMRFGSANTRVINRRASRLDRLRRCFRDCSTIELT